MTGGLTIAVVPARAGSKGVKNKNLRPVMGRPLVAHSIECGLACPSVDHVVLSTDGEEIARVGLECGAEAPFLRPAELAEDTSAMLPVMQHAVEACEQLYQKPIDTLVLLHPTSPLRTVEDVEQCISLLRAGDCDAVISARPARRNPYFNMMVQDGQYARLVIRSGERVGRRQDAPSVYDLDTSVWAYSRRALMEERARIPEKTKIYVIPEERSIDLDTEFDFESLEALLAHRQQPSWTARSIVERQS